MRGRSFGYTQGNSLLHRADALTKLAWLLLAATLGFLLTRWWQVALHVAVLAALAVGVSRAEPRRLLAPLGLFTSLASLLVVFHLLTRHEGEELLRVGFVAVHADGLGNGVLYSLRVLAVMLASWLFVRTTSPRALVTAGVRLGVPYRYAWMLTVALLAIPVFEAEYTVVREAQLIRGVRPGSRVRQQLDLLGRYTRSLLVSGLRRVEHLALAMDARAFGAHPTRTFTDPHHLTPGGMALALVWAAATTAATWGRLV